MPNHLKKRYDVYLTDKQKEQLQKLSKVSGISESAIIRHFIDSNCNSLIYFIMITKKNGKNHKNLEVQEARNYNDD